MYVCVRVCAHTHAPIPWWAIVLPAYRLPVTATTTEPAAVPTMLPRATPKVERTSNGVSAGIVLGSLVGGSVGGALLFYIYSRWQKISSLKRDELQARPSTRNLIDNGRGEQACLGISVINTTCTLLCVYVGIELCFKVVACSLTCCISVFA